MIQRLFKGVTPGLIIVNAVILLSVWTGPFINTPPEHFFCFDGKPMPLYSLLKNIAGNTEIGILINFSFVVFISFLLVSLNTSLFFIPERTTLPSILFGLFSGIFIPCQLLNPVLPASLLMIVALKRIISAYRKEGTAFSFFDASLLIGTGALFYANLIWFGIILLTGVVILKGYSLKETILSVTGLFMPFALLAGIYYVFSFDLAGLAETIKFNLSKDCGGYLLSKPEIAALTVSGISVLAGVLYLFPQVKKIKIKSRKIFILLLWWFLVSAALFLFSPSSSVEVIYLTAVPSVYFITYMLVVSRVKIIRELMLAGIVISVALVQILSYF